MLSTLKSAVKAEDTRKKILFTLMMFLVFRIGAHIPVPNIDVAAIAELTEKAKFEDRLASIVDIEVLSNTTNIAQKTVQEVCEHVEYCHIVEKDVFYRLLSDNYVDSHNPVWR